MELDEFKAHWNTIQDKEFNEQTLTKEKLEHIIMSTTNALDYLQKKTTYWMKINKSTNQMLKGILIPFLLIILVKASFMAGKTNTIVASLSYAGTTLAYLVIIVIHYFVTAWTFKRQQEVFASNNSGNLKETLTKTITDFNRFYVQFNIIYLFLYPVYFYAVIKLITFWTPSTNTLLLTCGAATMVALVSSHIYYKLKFFDKLKTLKANLRELEAGE